VGWLITFVLFCLGMTAASLLATGGDTGLGWYFLPISLIYGFPFASILGLPLAILAAWPLRRLRRQWLHVCAFAMAAGWSSGSWWLPPRAVGPAQCTAPELASWPPPAPPPAVPR